MPIQRHTQANKPTKTKFSYRPRTAEQMQRRANQGGSSRESFINPDVKFFIPAVGDNRIRVLPPTWDDPEHFGLEIFVHYGIGADNNSYLCLDKMQRTTGHCPICAERQRAENSGEKEYADTLRPSKRIAAYVIDRHREEEGVLLWNMPYTIDRDVCKRAVDKDTGEVFQLDDPDNGYDLLFSREGQGQTTKYVGIDIARRAQPLSDDPELADKWLQYAIDSPVPSQLVYHDADHITASFSGAPATDDDDDKNPPTETVRVPSARSRSSKPVDLTENAIQGMDEEAILNLIDEKGITEDQLGDAAEGSLEALKDAVCEILFPGKQEEIAEETAEESPKGSLRDRLARLRTKK